MERPYTELFASRAEHFSCSKRLVYNQPYLTAGQAAVKVPMNCASSLILHVSLFRKDVDMFLMDVFFSDVLNNASKTNHDATETEESHFIELKLLSIDRKSCRKFEFVDFAFLVPRSKR
ncbi:unnamed protein product [Acanthoscelides obtectus]|uniref:Uncharacterized protein n=1 Tax=Acanthoscelides obtectus TaxID=200917 RepID=A0A9P0Q754_ACAOB|nr:unnamed protein product [Acanthoscelides obtectus]CAK1646901.1 hypothetical protein AOBTE_LOCUS14931 [Acanthoscelides obtectus]